MAAPASEKNIFLMASSTASPKINIATAIRQPYEVKMGESIVKAQEGVYETMVYIIKEELKICDSASKLLE